MAEFDINSRDDLMALKETIHADCIKMLVAKKNMLEDEMNNLQKSYEMETKSSAGDKYETGRSMISIEKEKLTSALNLVKRNLNFLNSINTAYTEKEIRPGSMVVTNKSIFYISVALGKINVGNYKNVYAISPASPLGKELKGQTAKKSVVVNGNTLLIKAVC